MRKIFINGHGWSGSSAFIDFLNKTTSTDYLVVPGEFDDFRVPGTMREALSGSNSTPSSHRQRRPSSLFKLWLRSLISDDFFITTKFSEILTRSQAARLFRSHFIDAKHFNLAVSKLSKSPLIQEKKYILEQWIENLSREYCKNSANEQVIFFEQFFLFDDNYELYNWLDFDHLLLFIRDPSTQLSATKESTILYHGYPWQAQFLIGGSENLFKQRQLCQFVQTTISRYSWIIKFLLNIPASKITIVDFHDFLFNHTNVVSNISSRIDLPLHQNIPNFDLSSSVSRNNQWAPLEGIDNSLINQALLHAAQEYDIFKQKLRSHFYFA